MSRLWTPPHLERGKLAPPDELDLWMGIHPFIGKTGPASPPVGGYVVWYDASRITGVADAASLSSWSDGSGNGNNLTTASAPTYYKTTAGKLVNGLPAVWFNGTANNMVSSTTPNVMSGASAYTICVVALDAGHDATRAIFTQQLTNVFYFMFSGTGVTDTQVRDTGGTSYTATAGTNTINVPYQASGVCTGNSGTLTAYFNGTAGSGVAMPAALQSGTAELVLGSNQAGQFFWNGAICEVLMWASALSTANRQSTESYLKTKWGTP